MGSLVAKTLSSASAAGLYGAQRVAPPPVAFDVFSVQVRPLLPPIQGAGAAGSAAGRRAVYAGSITVAYGWLWGKLSGWGAAGCTHAALMFQGSRVMPPAPPRRPAPTPSWRTLPACCSGGRPSPAVDSCTGAWLGRAVVCRCRPVPAPWPTLLRHACLLLPSKSLHMCSNWILTVVNKYIKRQTDRDAAFAADIAPSAPPMPGAMY